MRTQLWKAAALGLLVGTIGLVRASHEQEDGTSRLLIHGVIRVEFTEWHLDRQYPYSRFILTTRELESWLDSRERKVARNLASPDYQYAFRTVDRPGWTKNRVEYLANLDRYFAGRPGDFLVINIPAGEGWDKLYGSNYERLMLDYEPAAWIHGHVHRSLEYQVGKTTVACNPRGYVRYGENDDFVPARTTTIN